LNQVNGPVTNPDQTAIDPSFAIRFYDHQRSAGVNWKRLENDPKMEPAERRSFIEAIAEASAGCVLVGRGKTVCCGM